MRVDPVAFGAGAPMTTAPTTTPQTRN
jgi:hypothetical protein